AFSDRGRSDDVRGEQHAFDLRGSETSVAAHGVDGGDLAVPRPPRDRVRSDAEPARRFCRREQLNAVGEPARARATAPGTGHGFALEPEFAVVLAVAVAFEDEVAFEVAVAFEDEVDVDV